MKKFSIKSYVAGMLTMVLLFGTTLAYAETKQTIEAIFGKAKLVVDGKTVDKETLLYDGTTYVPLRAAAEVLGMEVEWDGATNTAYIDKAGTNRQIGKMTEPAHTPAPKSQTVTFKTADELEKYLIKNYGKLTTSVGTFDFSDYISVYENENIDRPYDIMISVYWSTVSALEIDPILKSIKYTDEQKNELKEALKKYQNDIAYVAISGMPNKKIRGGFMVAGYEYPNLRIDYYEIVSYGWKNYYCPMLGGYNDSTISDFQWHDFNYSILE